MRWEGREVPDANVSQWVNGNGRLRRDRELRFGICRTVERNGGKRSGWDCGFKERHVDLYGTFTCWTFLLTIELFFYFILFFVYLVREGF